MPQPSRPWSLTATLALACAARAFAAEPGFTITQPAADGVYKPGETITWTVRARDFATPPAAGSVQYQVQRNGAAVVAQGAVELVDGRGTITATLTEPGTLLATVTVKGADKGKDVKALAGAVVEPLKITPSAPKPDDFDAFWEGKLKALAAVPVNPVLEPVDTGVAGIEYSRITMDNINGTHIRGQLAKPKKEGKFPAMLIVQWAGVYPLKREWVTGPAANGWLTLNILAHDQPIDQPEQFYKDLGNGALKNYTGIGNDDRETSYFLRMFLACPRAVDYLAGRDDWDGRTLIVTGASQGGLQSFVAAGLNPKVTAMLVDVPAGCDNTATLAGRAIGWPYWVPKAEETKKLAASRYYDAVNFATRVKCPALVALGLLDATARPTGILAAYNQLSGAKELVIMPNAQHQGDHAPYPARSAAWKAALKDGNPPPIK